MQFRKIYHYVILQSEKEYFMTVISSQSLLFIVSYVYAFHTQPIHLLNNQFNK